MEALISGVAGFTLLHFMSHPKSGFQKKFPNATFKRFSFSPRFSVEIKNRIFHLHHWMLFVGILGVTQLVELRFIPYDIMHGFLLGGILQGLMYKDSFKIMHHAHEFHSKVKKGSYHKFGFLRKIVN